MTRRECLALVLLLAVQCFFLVSGLFVSAPTSDEPNHLAAGLAALTTGDFRFNRDHPPLQNLLCALPAWILYRPRLDFDNMAWERAVHLGLFSRKMLLANPENFEQIFFAGRFGTVLLTLGLTVTLFLAVRNLFGFLPAFVSSAFLVLEPNILAHGRLITTDMGPTLFFLLSTMALCRLLQRPTLRSSLFLGLSLGAGLLAKHSMVIAIPAFVLTAILCHAPAAWRKIRNGKTFHSVLVWLCGKKTLYSVGLVTGVAFLGVWAGFGFEIGDPVREERPPNWSQTWNFMQGMILPLKFFIGSTTGAFSDSTDPCDPAWVFMRRWTPMFDYFEGFFFQVNHARDYHNGYLMEKVSPVGWWYYYPVNFLIKTPISLILASILGCFSWWKIPGFTIFERLCFVFPPLFYFFCICAGNNANIGWRHALPVVPFLCLWSGSFIRYLEIRFPSITIGPRRAVVACGLLVSGAAWSAATSFPDTLPYLNAAARSVAPPIYWTADSNLDWGQDVRKLKEYVQRKNIDHIYLLHFGPPEVVKLYGIPAEKPDPAKMDKPGIYAISVSVLCGLAEFGPTETLRRFREITPDCVIGASIFVYDLRGAQFSN